MARRLVGLVSGVCTANPRQMLLKPYSRYRYSGVQRSRCRKCKVWDSPLSAPLAGLHCPPASPTVLACPPSGAPKQTTRRASGPATIQCHYQRSDLCHMRSPRRTHYLWRWIWLDIFSGFFVFEVIHIGFVEVSQRRERSVHSTALAGWPHRCHHPRRHLQPAATRPHTVSKAYNAH